MKNIFRDQKNKKTLIIQSFCEVYTLQTCA